MRRRLLRVVVLRVLRLRVLRLLPRGFLRRRVFRFRGRSRRRRRVLLVVRVLLVLRRGRVVGCRMVLLLLMLLLFLRRRAFLIRGNRLVEEGRQRRVGLRMVRRRRRMGMGCRMRGVRGVRAARGLRGAMRGRWAGMMIRRRRLPMSDGRSGGGWRMLRGRLRMSARWRI